MHRTSSKFSLIECKDKCLDIGYGFLFLQDDARQFFSMASAPGEDGKLSYELGMIMKRLWSDSGVQACFLRYWELRQND